MRKGQAAMEFLMTYGWAILIVLAAIGALAYFGVLSPNKLLPERTVFQAPVPNVDNAVVTWSTANSWYDFSIAFRNNKGVDIYVNNSVDSNLVGGSIKFDSPTGTVCSAQSFTGIGRVAKGAAFTATWHCTIAQQTSGTRMKATFYMNYTNTDTYQIIPVSGSVDAKFP